MIIQGISLQIGRSVINSIHQKFLSHHSTLTKHISTHPHLSEIFFHGFNPDNSLLDRYVEIANEARIHSDNISTSFPFDVGLAYETFLINPLGADSTLYTSVIPKGRVQQLQTTTIKGKIDEWFVAVGANHNNKVYLGATLGIPVLRYREQTTFQEIDVEDTIPDFNSFAVSNTIKTDGVGVNLKLGLLYKVNKYIRLGGAIHTPTYYRMTDRFSSFMTSDFDSLNTEDWSSPNGEFKYYLLTPFKLVGSLSLLAEKYGFISVDYEWLDYGVSLFDFSTNGFPNEELDESQVNQAIEAKYQPASNIRVGIEGKFDTYRVRAGYAIYGSPFKSSIDVGGADNSRTSLSFGLGIREAEYFIDLAYVRTHTQEFFSPYDLSNELTPGAENDITQNNVLLTFGLKF